MKKNAFLRLASVLLIVTLLSTCVISGTFAKYTSQAKGDKSIQVAAWSITVNGSQIAVKSDATQKPTLPFDLFATVLDTKDGNEEEDVLKGKIAPGTKGAFTMTVANLSEVNAHITFDMSGSATRPVPLQFTAKVGNGQFGAMTTDMAKLAGYMETDLAMGASTEITVQWEWPFERGADASDTDIGIDADAKTVEYLMSATLHAVQVD